MLFSDEDLQEIKRLSAIHLDLRAIAVRLKIDPEMFVEEYMTGGGVLRQIVDEAITGDDIEMRERISERAKDPEDHEAARQNRSYASQARWDRYKSKLLFDKKLDETEALRMAIEHGAGKLSDEMKGRFEKLDFIRALYTQMNSRSYIISAVRVKWPHVTWSVARNLYYESLNFFNSDVKVSKEVWANVYADGLDVISSMAFEKGELDVAGKYKLEAARMRGVGKDEPPQVPEEIFNRRPVLYTMRMEDVGVEGVNRNELARFIDGLDVTVKEKRKAKRDALIEKLNIEELLNDGDEQENQE